MWTSYKKEIVAREKEHKDFLKSYYQQNRIDHDKNMVEEGMDTGLAPPVTVTRLKSMSPRAESLDDWPVELDSDEEPLSFYDRQASLKKKKAEAAATTEGGKEKQKTILEQFAANETNVNATTLPKWLHKYLVFRFNLLDRTGDNIVDGEEFEFVLSEFGIKEKDARQAFTIFTEVSDCQIDRLTFWPGSLKIPRKVVNPCFGES